VLILLLIFLPSSLLVTAASAAVSAGASSLSVSRVPIDEDPNARYICQGSLGDYVACQCKEEDSELSCINAQFVDTDIFLHVNNHYRHLRRVTFHGNNFQDLPDTPLFGSASHDTLELLNISANYIVNLNDNALKNMPNLRILDLSNNEIVLRDEDVNFLSHTPKLTHLYLRRAFPALVNRTVQFTLLMTMLEKAKLVRLSHLDLSYNFLHAIPYDIGCPLPSLHYLDVRQNLMNTLNVNATCLSQLHTFDLSRNHLHYLDEQFRTTVSGLAGDQVLVLRNSFFCDCNSAPYITWIRTTSKIREKLLLTCARASPAIFVGSRLVEVPLPKLDCSISLTISSAVGTKFEMGLTILFLFSAYLIR